MVFRIESNSEFAKFGVKMASVAVLLSTYNGSKYLGELLESVLAQKDVEVHVCVRDDGSTDETADVLNEYGVHIDKVIFGKNMGPAQSFLELVRSFPGFDYYAYCDQDDVWYTNKLSYAIQRLEESEKGEPALFMSTYDVVDDNLNYGFTYDMEFEKPLTLQETIVYRSPSGCTMVFNKSLRDLVAVSAPDFVRMHDFWTLLVAEAFHARIVTDQTPLLMYRQHGDNTVGIVPTAKERFVRLIRSALHGDNERWRQAHNLLSSYRDVMPVDSKAVLNEIDTYRMHFGNRFKLAFDRSFRTGNRRVDLMFKSSVLLGLF